MCSLDLPRRVSYLTLEPYLESLLESGKETVKIIVRDPKVPDNSGVYSEFFSHLNGKNIGVFNNDTNTGKFCDELWDAFPKDMTKVDASGFIEEVAAVKEVEWPHEVTQIEKAGKVTAFVMKKLISRLEDIINDEERISHEQVADKLQKQVFEDQESKELQRLHKANPDIEPAQVDSSLPIKIQSGGK